MIEGKTLNFDQCKAAVRDCLDRSWQGKAMTDKADADLAALDSVIIGAGHDPAAVVTAAYEA